MTFFYLYATLKWQRPSPIGGFNFYFFTLFILFLTNFFGSIFPFFPLISWLGVVIHIPATWRGSCLPECSSIPN